MIFLGELPIITDLIDFGHVFLTPYEAGYVKTAFPIAVFIHPIASLTLSNVYDKYYGNWGILTVTIIRDLTNINKYLF